MKASRNHKVIKYVHATEKTNVLKGLKNDESNKCIRRFTQEKHVFVVDRDANKVDVKRAIEGMFDVAVSKVNTILMKPKSKNAKGKGFRKGKTIHIKKAVVTLMKDSSLEMQFNNIMNSEKVE
ncbi:MAG: 50S ribosomal protein L23 [Chlamydiia bacterium]|nr:50S ribosomal protein L23 [Chlamydiia bacterium]